MDKFLNGVAGVGTIVTVAAIIEKFSGVGIDWKLGVAAVSCVLVVFSLCRWLVTLATRGRRVGFGGEEGRTPGRYYLLSALGLMVACGLFVFMAWVMTEWLTFKIEEERTQTASLTDFFGPNTPVKQVIIQVPPQSKNECTPIDANPNSFPRLKYQMVDWSSVSPRLTIDGFQDPQRLRIECKPPTMIRGVTLVPTSSEVFLDSQLHARRIGAYILGGLIWLSGFGFCAYRFSR